MVTDFIFNRGSGFQMSVSCQFCSKRVASLAALSGHYRRQHPERIPARSGASTMLPTGKRALPTSAPRHVAVQRVPDSAYVSRLVDVTADEPPPVAPKPDAKPKPRVPQKRDWGSWLWLAGIVAVVLVFLLSTTGGTDSGDSGLVSTYQPETGGQ
jgi:hypothetical protein